MVRMIREPLFHFFLLGLAIFAWFSVQNPVDPNAANGEAIVIDDEDVARLVAQFEGSWRRPPTPDELAGLVDAVVRQEVLVREARALGLDRGDSIVRQRLAQKMEFLTTAVAQSMRPEEATLVAHMEAHPDRFARPAEVGFEQIALAPNADETAIAAALAALEGGADPTTLASTSLLPGALPLSPQRVVDGAFGRGFFDALAPLPVGRWAGPVLSGYGPHLVRVTERRPAELPPFEAIREEVLFDWRRAMTTELSAAQYDGLRARYAVQLPDFGTAADAGAQ